VSITHRPPGGSGEGTFELSLNGRRAGYLSYSLTGADRMAIDYVEVDPAHRGKGYGVELVGAAVEWARANQRRVTPFCSYARAVMHRTRAFQDVLAETAF
jgi:predicted GNAT family acetyltransferase